MLSDKINNFLIFSNIVVGCFAFMVLWFHIVRTVKGNALMKDRTVRGYANVNFIFSLIMLVVIWVTTVGKDFALMMTFVIFMIGWIVTVIGAFVISSVAKIPDESKKNILKIGLRSMVRVGILGVVIWLIY